MASCRASAASIATALIGLPINAPCNAASASQKSRCASMACIDAADLLARIGQQLEHADQHAVVAQHVLVGDASCAAARSRRDSGARCRTRCDRRRSSRALASSRRRPAARCGSAAPCSAPARRCAARRRNRRSAAECRARSPSAAALPVSLLRTPAISKPLTTLVICVRPCSRAENSSSARAMRTSSR